MGRARNAAIWLMAAEPTTDDGRLVLERILEWDGACEIESLGCAAWSMFEYRLHRDVFDDDLGPLARDYVGTPPAQMLIDALFDDPEAAWWDDASTPNRETSPEIVARALDEAGSSLATSYGEPTNWTWGRLHTATFQEATIGSSGIGPLEWYFNDGPHAVGGASGALDNTYYRFARAYPDPLEPDYVPVGPDRRVRRDEPAKPALRDRHDRPGRRPDRDHDRPERQPVRPPLQRHDRPMAER